MARYDEIGPKFIGDIYRVKWPDGAKTNARAYHNPGKPGWYLQINGFGIIAWDEIVGREVEIELIRSNTTPREDSKGHTHFVGDNCGHMNDGELVNLRFRLNDALRICDKLGCDAAVIRKDDGSRVCAKGHGSRWVDRAYLTATEEHVRALRTVMVAGMEKSHPGKDWRKCFHDICMPVKEVLLATIAPPGAGQLSEGLCVQCDGRGDIPDGQCDYPSCKASGVCTHVDGAGCVCCDGTGKHGRTGLGGCGGSDMKIGVDPAKAADPTILEPRRGFDMTMQTISCQRCPTTKVMKSHGEALAFIAEHDEMHAAAKLVIKAMDDAIRTPFGELTGAIQAYLKGTDVDGRLQVDMPDDRDARVFYNAISDFVDARVGAKFSERRDCALLVLIAATQWIAWHLDEKHRREDREREVAKCLKFRGSHGSAGCQMAKGHEGHCYPLAVGD